MQCVSEKVRTLAASMPIIDAKVGASGPLFWVNVGPTLRWKQIGDNRNPILIVISHETLIGVCRIPPNHPSPFI